MTMWGMIETICPNCNKVFIHNVLLSYNTINGLPADYVKFLETYVICDRCGYSYDYKHPTGMSKDNAEYISFDIKRKIKDMGDKYLSYSEYILKDRV